MLLLCYLLRQALAACTHSRSLLRLHAVACCLVPAWLLQARGAGHTTLHHPAGVNHLHLLLHAHRLLLHHVHYLLHGLLGVVHLGPLLLAQRLYRHLVVVVGDGDGYLLAGGRPAGIDHEAGGVLQEPWWPHAVAGSARPLLVHLDWYHDGGGHHMRHLALALHLWVVALWVALGDVLHAGGGHSTHHACGHLLRRGNMGLLLQLLAVRLWCQRGLHVCCGDQLQRLLHCEAGKARCSGHSSSGNIALVVGSSCCSCDRLHGRHRLAGRA